MAHRLRLGEGGKIDRRLAAMRAEAARFALDRVDVDAGNVVAPDLEEQRLLDLQSARLPVKVSLPWVARIGASAASFSPGRVGRR